MDFSNLNLSSEQETELINRFNAFLDEFAETIKLFGVESSRFGAASGTIAINNVSKELELRKIF